jgi:hypothetical protein
VDGAVDRRRRLVLRGDYQRLEFDHRERTASMNDDVEAFTAHLRGERVSRRRFSVQHGAMLGCPLRPHDVVDRLPQQIRCLTAEEPVTILRGVDDCRGRRDERDESAVRLDRTRSSYLLLGAFDEASLLGGALGHGHDRSVSSGRPERQDRLARKRNRRRRGWGWSTGSLEEASEVARAASCSSSSRSRSSLLRS